MTDPGRHRPARLAAGLVVAALASVMAGCGGSSGPSGASGASTMPSRPADGTYVHLAGHGNERVGPVTLPAAWTVAWHFDCSTSKAGPFRLTVTLHNGATETLADQTGLGGGGYKPFTTSGATRFAITSACSWNLVVGPPGTDSALGATSTTAPG